MTEKADQSGSWTGSKMGIHELVGRALIDEGFRARLLDKESQTDALRSMGIEPTDEVLDALNGSVDALQRLADSFGGPRAAT